MSLIMDIDIDYGSILIDATKAATSNHITKRYKRAPTALPPLSKSHIRHATCIISNNNMKD